MQMSAIPLKTQFTTSHYFQTPLLPKTQQLNNFVLQVVSFLYSFIEKVTRQLVMLSLQPSNVNPLEQL